MDINITPQRYYVSYKSTQQLKKPTTLPSEKDLFLAVRKDPSVLGKINPEDGYSLFHTLVANNYMRLISYLTAKEELSTDILNQVCNNKTPFFFNRKIVSIYDYPSKVIHK